MDSGISARLDLEVNYSPTTWASSNAWHSQSTPTFKLMPMWTVSAYTNGRLIIDTGVGCAPSSWKQMRRRHGWYAILPCMCTWCESRVTLLMHVRCCFGFSAKTCVFVRAQESEIDPAAEISQQWQPPSERHASCVLPDSQSDRARANFPCIGWLDMLICHSVLPRSVSKLVALPLFCRSTYKYCVHGIICWSLMRQPTWTWLLVLLNGINCSSTRLYMFRVKKKGPVK